ncbi:hypothetical protein FUT87_14960 [Mitsuaria sp. TWR114]|jgi:hypothetical protein|uniref:hypothetical protein n=1 Tax=Mitsuaria sp. TWR114 TaxID=2601731 RepID=UPI0011BFDCDC|nr:hypothetical protein [Mitsuaria sp. TWR114]TXD85850.1 hypothetical protein FUT87_14960 [Mitsuaria sp. TWR114]
MSKKRNGKKGGRRVAYRRSEKSARIAVKLPEPCTFAHKLGTLGLPQACENVIRRVEDVQIAIQLAQQAGIIDEFGNLTPEYQ